MTAAIYARVSVKHRDRRDLSIEAQTELCRRFLRGRGDIQAADIQVFSDCGYSGRRFDRPGFLRMRELAERRALRCVVVKDLSRLGRDYRRVGELAEKFFPAHGVRLLSVAEGYDSEDVCANPAAAGLYHLLNEWYARDIGRKVALVKQQKRAEGNYLGSAAPYGYRIVENQGIRVLEPDESFWVLEKMSALRGEGFSSAEIVQWLWQHRINPPSAYRNCGKVAQEDGRAERWAAGTVRRLLSRGIL